MITLHQVTKRFSQFDAINSVSLTIQKGEIHGIIGASGAGKSTLLRLMNLLEIPDKGKVEVNGQFLTELTSKDLRLARQSIGMIFQHFNLVSNKTIFDNVAVPLELVKMSRQNRHRRVIECLRFVGLEGLQNKYPTQLSGGQKQRVAIARALANHPQVLLCDEPTSSLDPNTTAEILTVLQDINKSLGVTIIIVSHEMEVIKSICHRVTVMADGQVYDTLDNEPIGLQNLNSNPSWFVEQLKKESDHNNA